MILQAIFPAPGHMKVHCQAEQGNCFMQSTLEVKVLALRRDALWSNCLAPVLQHDYKAFAPSVTMDNVDWESAPALQESPVTSAICEPVNGSEIEQGTDEIPGMYCC